MEGFKQATVRIESSESGVFVGLWKSAVHSVSTYSPKRFCGLFTCLQPLILYHILLFIFSHQFAPHPCLKTSKMPFHCSSKLLMQDLDCLKRCVRLSFLHLCVTPTGWLH